MNKPSALRPPVSDWQPDRDFPTPLLKRERLDDPYVVAGDRAYLIGAQDGSFPDVGHHVPGEMWGLWAHPHKLLDGYWCGVRPPGQATPVWLLTADHCVVEATAVTQHYDLHDLGLHVARRQWVPEGRPGLVVELTFEDLTSQERVFELVVAARSDLRPGWLQEAEDGDDTAAYDTGSGFCLMEDSTRAWAVAWGAAQLPMSFAAGPHEAPRETIGRGCTAALCYALVVSAGGTGTLTLGFHGALRGPATALSELAALLADLSVEQQAKDRVYRDVVRRSHLEVDDPLLERAWNWVKCSYRWLERDVPGIGRGLGAGLPEYPWWFSCDSAYALRGLLPLGGFETAIATLRLLATSSAQHNQGNGRIIHELSGSGVVVNPGNTQETPQFTCAVWETYLWSGDETFLRDLYPVCRKGVLEWTLGMQDPDGDFLPEGYGLTEVAGLNAEVIDTAAWTAAALEVLGAMAARLDDAPTASRCAALAPRAREAVLRRYWLPDRGIYADVVATPRQLLERLNKIEGQFGRAPTPRMCAHLADVAMRARSLPPDEEVAWYFGNWPVLAPLELGLAPDEQAHRAFDMLEGPAFSGPDGVYLSAIAQGASMSIATGSLAAAEVSYGRVDKALEYARQIAGSLDLHMPGGISEMSPDGGCFVQAWSGYGVVHPVTAGVFGLAPDAARRRLIVRPCLPSGWDTVALRGLRVGTAFFDVEIRRDPTGQTRCTVQGSGEGWDIVIEPAELVR